METQVAGNFPGLNFSLVKRGFSRPVLDSQAVFRSVLNAFSYPGRIAEINSYIQPPFPLDEAGAAVCLTFFDSGTPVWTESSGSEELAAWLKFHCGAKITDKTGDALFAVITKPESMPDLNVFSHGTHRRPDISATLVIKAENLDCKKGLKISGPGIIGTLKIQADGLPETFWSQRRMVNSSFPLGVDIVFTSGRRIVALPRTCRIME